MEKNLDIFMVHQDKHFEIDEGIFVKSEVEQEEERNEKEKSSSRTDKITIYIYSYKYTVSYLKNYIDNITGKYLSSIKKNRVNKRFIYCLERVTIEKDEDSALDIWREDNFESARTFDNIFFDGKKEIISTFPIPNTKDDILEFLSLAYPKAKVKGNTWTKNNPENIEHNEFSSVWKTKCEQIIMKAREAASMDHARMLAELKREIGHLVVRTTTQVTGKILTAEDQHRLAEDTNRQIAA